ncbi:glycosyltransferase [Cetobacterium sp.]|uniref:glycosyltransferase n=1 Tax=Cetobacterium sp. TaxID=2071632 RepID=UPI003F303C34
MKKKVLFMVINMNVGGVEKALLNKLKTMSPKEYSVRVLMLEKYGGFLDSIPDWIEIDYIKGYDKIKYIFNNPPKKVILDFIKNKQFFKAAYYFMLFLILKITGSRELLLKSLFSNYSNYSEKYDSAIAYAGPMALIDYYILKKVKADKKIGWIHFDVTTIGLDKNLVKSIYKDFHEIRIVSNDAKIKFDSIFPEFKEKTKVVYNDILKDEILKLSNEKGFQDNYTGLRLLTVGRISKEKGQDLAIAALKKLVDSGVEARLYLVGDGAFKNSCLELAQSLMIEDKVIFLGTKKNPYPYMKECDIYIQPSRYEGYCITLAEALVFNKFIVATKFTGALEQLRYNEKSSIVDYSSDAISDGIKKLIKMVS